MTTVVIMPGGFHPFHAGHMALYNAARKQFPDAEVFVAATDVTKDRPFPFPIKEKLAYLAGVEPGHFVQVKSPFRADEITSKFNPEQDTLIFVRSTKDANEPPHAGGVLKSGKPAYLQPLKGTRKLDTFNKHAYMAYLPTVEFGPGITSASEIRSAWPSLDERRKTAMVMSLYPATQSNPKLAATVVKMLDTAIGSVGESHTVGYIQEREKLSRDEVDPELRQSRIYAKQHYSQFGGDEQEAYNKWIQRGLKHSQENDRKHDKLLNFLTDKIIRLERELKQAQQVQQPTTEDYIEEGR